MRFPYLPGAVLAFLAVPALSLPAAAEETYTLTLKDNAFVEETLHVPANTPFVLTVVNEDATVEEFESNSLHIEKIIAGGKSAKFRVGALRPGVYEFFGEFHMDTATGKIIAGADE
jgi:hypothetical protein